MKTKKILLGISLAALSLFTLASCSVEINNNNNNPVNTDPVVKEPKEDEITISVANKEFDGNPIAVTATATSGKTPKLEYKLAKNSDSDYSTLAPKEVGNYVVKATTSASDEYKEASSTKEFKISLNYLPEDYKQYLNTSAYVTVNNEKDFLDALYNAKTTYTNNFTEITENDGYVVRNNVRKNATNWTNAITKGLYLKNDDGSYTKIPSDIPFDSNDITYTASLTYYEDSPYSKVSYTQELVKEATVKVIEIASDLDLGYNKIKNLGAPAVYENWDNKKRLEGTTDIYCDPDIQEAGISKIKVENVTNLIIYSKNGSKLTHCGFNVSSAKNVKFINLEMDEIWMWEDSTSASPTIKVGDYDSFGWAYFKVSFSDNIVIDHCTFGKSFDGQIDYSNPYYQSMGTYQKAPYGATGSNGLLVSNCDFKAGSADKDGYLYKMMSKIEDEYQIYAANKTGYTYSNKSCRYYFTLRDSGLSFDDILYGIAIPQKKAFLWGDSGDSYKYNKYLTATLYNCTIKNIEDRLPKVRGGMAYVINTLVDNSEYFAIVDKIKAKQSAVTAKNSKYKLGAVSQGILAGLDASVYIESCEYIGIKEVLKNNDSLASDYPTVRGGYMIKNSLISGIYGSTSSTNNPFSSLVKNDLTTDAFAFKVNGEKTNLAVAPIDLEIYELKQGESLTTYFKTHSTGVI